MRRVAKVKWIALSFAVLAILSRLSAGATPVTIELPEPEQSLKAGEGRDVTLNNCQACHSLDYIATQPPRKGAPFWDAEVKKMVKVFGASISDEDAKKISAYLVQTY